MEGFFDRVKDDHFSSFLLNSRLAFIPIQAIHYNFKSCKVTLLLNHHKNKYRIYKNRSDTCKQLKILAKSFGSTIFIQSM